MKHRNIRNASHLGEPGCIQFKVKKKIQKLKCIKISKDRRTWFILCTEKYPNPKYMKKRVHLLVSWLYWYKTFTFLLPNFRSRTTSISNAGSYLTLKLPNWSGIMRWTFQINSLLVTSEIMFPWQEHRLFPNASGGILLSNQSLVIQVICKFKGRQLSETEDRISSPCHSTLGQSQVMVVTMARSCRSANGISGTNNR